jgi:hypothetical protein
MCRETPEASLDMLKMGIFAAFLKRSSKAVTGAVATPLLRLLS